MGLQGTIGTASDGGACGASATASWARTTSLSSGSPGCSPQWCAAFETSWIVELVNAPGSGGGAAEELICEGEPADGKGRAQLALGDVLIQLRRTSATLQACAMQPRAVN